MISLVFSSYERGGSEMLLALALADHADDNGENIFPSKAYLAQKTRQSPRTVQRQLADMVDAGWLLVVTPGGNGKRSSTRYRINPAWIQRSASLQLQPVDVKGDKLSPYDERKGDTAMSPYDEPKGDKSDALGRQTVHLRETQLCLPNHQEPSRTISSSREPSQPAPPVVPPPPPAGAVDPLGGGKTEIVIQAMVAELEAGRAISNPAAFAAKVCGDRKHIDTTTGLWLRSTAQFRIDDAANVRREQREAAERRFAEAERRSREAGERELERLAQRR